MEEIPAPQKPFDWRPQPEAATWIASRVEEAAAKSSFADDLARRLRRRTGTRFLDWIDAVGVPNDRVTSTELSTLGFTLDPDSAGHPRALWNHPGAIFPRVIVTNGSGFEIYIRAESVADFLAVQREPRETSIEGLPGAPLRRALVRREPATQTEFWAIERHGYPGFTPPPHDAEQSAARAAVLEAFTLRRRNFSSQTAGFDYLDQLVDAAIARIGVDQTASLFFTSERVYWERRNRAAQVQKSRQDAVGLGWANHDHHTYRSSRSAFRPLIALFQKLGLEVRERFYAGDEAGWGAQVMEQSNAGIVVFADVDLSPEELWNDFANEDLAPRDALGTVGLWCALHDDSIFGAGMHHLECQFDHDGLVRQLEAEHGIATMAPFTDFPYLKQAFTEGERWPVAEERIAALAKRGVISKDQADAFRSDGAIGSHLENLERNDGFKGFNQSGVSKIIAKTDPREQIKSD